MSFAAAFEAMSDTARPTPAPDSPPPKCAICLGTYTDTSYSNSCMHQFCFTCLLEWSKVKAECPLCKQPFKSIIHNVKPNGEYDEHVVEHIHGIVHQSTATIVLPELFPHEFQLRTTYSMDSGAQQMMLSHYVLTTYGFRPPTDQNYPRVQRLRRLNSSSDFRRLIYTSNAWANCTPTDLPTTRDITPESYRHNPQARNRLLPWLNRELNALLGDDLQQIMNVIDLIMDNLCLWHIYSGYFKNLLQPYLGTRTEHFIHEFSNFMKSPYDMIAYDAIVTYVIHSPSRAPPNHEDNDSDVAVVSITHAVTSDPMRRRDRPVPEDIEVIEITSDSSHDSDVILNEPPLPVVQVDSDSSSETETAGDASGASNQTTENVNGEMKRKPVLPLKLRLKHRRQFRELRPSSTSSSDSSNCSARELAEPYKKKYRHKKFKRSRRDKIKTEQSHVISSSSADESTRIKNADFDSDDNVPLARIQRKECREKARSSHGNPFFKPAGGENIAASQSEPSCSGWYFPERPLASASSSSLTESHIPNSTQYINDNNNSVSSHKRCFAGVAASNYVDNHHEYSFPRSLEDAEQTPLNNIFVESNADTSRLSYMNSLTSLRYPDSIHTANC